MKAGVRSQESVAPTRKESIMDNIEELKYQTLSILADHVGEASAIGMAELYQQVFGRPWDNRINDTRAMRTVITIMRNEGKPICSVSSSNGGGYFLAAAGSELTAYLKRGEHRALKILSRNARLKKLSLPDYLGQMRINVETEPCADAG